MLLFVDGDVRGERGSRDPMVLGLHLISVMGLESLNMVMKWERGRLRVRIRGVVLISWLWEDM